MGPESSIHLNEIVSLGIGVMDRICGGILRVKPAKYPHISLLPRKIPESHEIQTALSGGFLRVAAD